MTNPVSELPPSAQLLLTYLSDNGGASGASNEALGRAIGRSAASVKTAVGRLEDDGFVTVHRRRRNRHAGDATGRTIRLAGGAQ